MVAETSPLVVTHKRIMAAVLLNTNCPTCPKQCRGLLPCPTVSFPHTSSSRISARGSLDRNVMIVFAIGGPLHNAAKLATPFGEPESPQAFCAVLLIDRGLWVK